VRVSPQKVIVYEERAASARRRHGYEQFPPPFPNGWVFLCPSSAVERAQVMPLEVCGRHLVIFRAEDGTPSVLDAFCSHMGTHLGYGGFVSGQCIVCPYHEWEFDTTGKLCRVPYAPDDGWVDCGRARNHMRSYQVAETNGMIFAWLHADGAEPWDVMPFLSMPEEKGLRPITRIVDDDYLMHCMEPSHNSTDWYHFLTVHSALSQHWRAGWKWVQIEQTITPSRTQLENSVDDDGTPVKDKEVLIIDEVIKGVTLLNGWLKLPSRLNDFSKTQVRFSGPLLIRFHVEVAFCGTLIAYMPITPKAPFVTHLEFWSFASRGFPWIIAYLLTQFIRFTVNQDREVWEHRSHPLPRNRVKGDYNWGKYDQWLKQFYSEHSIGWTDSDLSW